MDYKTLYQLTDRPTPEPNNTQIVTSFGECNQAKSGAGNSIHNRNQLNKKGNNGLLPLSPPVTTDLVKVGIESGAPDGGADNYLCAKNEDHGRTYLGIASSKLNHPLPDLLDWYAQDLQALGEMPLSDVIKTARQYIDQREWFRGGCG